jgi:hypothetical protein
LPLLDCYIMLIFPVDPTLLSLCFAPAAAAAAARRAFSSVLQPRVAAVGPLHQPVLVFGPKLIHNSFLRFFSPLLLLLLLLLLLHVMPFPSHSHVLPLLDRYISLCLACMEVPRLTEPNMPSANNAIWSMGELVIRVSAAHHSY